LSIEFSKNIREDGSGLTFTSEELKGLPETVLERLDRNEDGTYTLKKENGGGKEMPNSSIPITVDKFIYQACCPVFFYWSTIHRKTASITCLKWFSTSAWSLR